MPSFALINQHTNNYGDDAAGVALVQRCLDNLRADRVDIFYFRDGASGGLPIEDERCTHHRLSLLAGDQGLGKRVAFASLTRLLGRSRDGQELSRLVRVCSSADTVFVSPAGANIGVYRDWAYLLLLFTLVMSGVRPVFMQNTIGASGSWLFDRVAQWVLRRSELAVREVRSHDWLAAKGHSSYLGVDTALLLDPIDDETHPRTTGPYIAVVLTRLSRWNTGFRHFDDGDSWVKLLAETIAESADKFGLDVELVPHLYGTNSERSYLESVAAALHEAGASVRIAAEDGLDSYRRSLANATVVVSMRYHGLVLAAAAGTPCVSLAYENKMVEAAQYLGMSQLSMGVTDVTAAELSALIATAIESQPPRIVTANRIDALREIALGPIRAVESRSLRG